MKRLALLTVALAIVGLGAASALAAAPERPSFSAEEKATLESGEPILREEQYDDAEGNRAGRGVGYILIKGDAAMFWAVALDFNRYAEFYPNLHAAQLTRRDGNHYFVAFTLDIIGMIKVRYHIDHTHLLDQDRMTWVMDKTQKNDFEETTGFWQVWSWDDRNILVCYSVYIKTGRFIPGFAQSFVEKIGLTRWGLKKVVVSMKKRVELGEGYKGEGDRPESAEPPPASAAPPTPKADSSPPPGP